MCKNRTAMPIRTLQFCAAKTQHLSKIETPKTDRRTAARQDTFLQRYIRMKPARFDHIDNGREMEKLM